MRLIGLLYIIKPKCEIANNFFKFNLSCKNGRRSVQGDAQTNLYLYNTHYTSYYIIYIRRRCLLMKISYIPWNFNLNLARVPRGKYSNINKLLYGRTASPRARYHVGTTYQRTYKML